MRLVRHLVWFELRSLSPVLGAWATVLLLQAAVFWMGPPFPAGGRRPEIEISLDTAAMVMRYAVTAVLMAVLVQRHLPSNLPGVAGEHTGDNYSHVMPSRSGVATLLSASSYRMKQVLVRLDGARGLQTPGLEIRRV
jgi:hypothetical protein